MVEFTTPVAQGLGLMAGGFGVLKFKGFVGFRIKG